MLISIIVDSAPPTLNPLNKLALAFDSNANFSTTIINSIGTKAPKDSPTFTGAILWVSTAMVKLYKVDNTSDLEQPISAATQTALDLKAYKTTTYTKMDADVEIANPVDSAPATLDTL